MNMLMNFVSSHPADIYMVGIVLLVLLAAALCSSIWYYWRAKDLAPVLKKKELVLAEIAELEKKVEKAQIELKNMLYELTQAEKTIAEGKSQQEWLKKTQQEREDLRVQYEKLKEEWEIAKTNLEGTTQKVTARTTELAELNQKIYTQEEKFKGMEYDQREKLEEIENRREDAKREVARLDSQAAALGAQVKALEARVAELKDAEKEYKKREEEMNRRMQEMKREAEKEIEGKRRAYEDGEKAKRAELEKEFDARRKSFEESLARQTKQLRELQEKQIEELKNSIKGLEARKAKLAGDVAEYEVQSKKNTELRAENFRLSKDQDELRKKIEEGKSIIAKADRLKINEANMWKDLERPLSGVITEPQGWMEEVGEGEESAALSSFCQALDKCGYKFEERTVKAFHTGLLCGEYSPLVVLAGISGTGKSLLPELYAQAFGMNFLPVAVQPRWDGPQDVFGFYNHMEGRYKATEFARLLWQFDQFNNPEAEELYSDESSLPMSLVLLDEMNLARVEYYFSELLSKLEIRNRIKDPTDENLRTLAEIELEYGASAIADVKKDMGRRLFVWHNILFVGTMNEDESTQMLSSKVIDRSNVIRFGTPESLRKAPEGERFKDMLKNFVSFATWQKWAQKKGDALEGFEEHIKALRDALKAVDCGFGHRTELAIQKYVEYYPGNKKDALADQIEMKILPKLNGIECDKVRDYSAAKINEVLAAIDDQAVSHAFAESLNQESTFFAWKGVQR